MKTPFICLFLLGLAQGSKLISTFHEESPLNDSEFVHTDKDVIEFTNSVSAGKKFTDSVAALP